MSHGPGIPSFELRSRFEKSKRDRFGSSSARISRTDAVFRLAQWNARLVASQPEKKIEALIKPEVTCPLAAEAVRKFLLRVCVCAGTASRGARRTMKYVCANTAVSGPVSGLVTPPTASG